MKLGEALPANCGISVYGASSAPRICPTGFYGALNAATFQESYTCTACPVGKTSDAGASSVSDCVDDQMFYIASGIIYTRTVSGSTYTSPSWSADGLTQISIGAGRGRYLWSVGGPVVWCAHRIGSNVDWYEVGGLAAVQVEVSNGQVFALGPPDVNGFSNIYYRTASCTVGDSWHQITGAASQLSVSHQHVWVANPGYSVFLFDRTTADLANVVWTYVSDTTALFLDVGSEIWIYDTAGVLKRKAADNSGSWVTVSQPSGCTPREVSVGSTYVWLVCTNNIMYNWPRTTSGPWAQIVTGVTHGIDADHGITCKPGTWSATGTEPCTPCAAGKYSSNANYGQTSISLCLSCSSGKYSALTGVTTATACTNCATGKYSGSGAGGCTSCSVGRYANSAGLGSCACCNGSSYTGSSGSSTCSICYAPLHVTQAGGCGISCHP